MTASGATAELLLRVRALRFAREGGGFELQLPRFDLSAGERVAVVGPSGSGKTTVLGLCAGLLRPHAGELWLLDTPVRGSRDAARRALRRRLGLVFQELELVPHLDLWDNVLLPARLTSGGVSAELGARAARLLSELGIEAARRRRPDSLSRGERQRVAVARALVGSPRLILADEPTASLDAESAARVWSTLRAACEETGAALLASTHESPDPALFGRTLDVRRLESWS